MLLPKSIVDIIKSNKYGVTSNDEFCMMAMGDMKLAVYLERLAYLHIPENQSETYGLLLTENTGL